MQKNKTIAGVVMVLLLLFFVVGVVNLFVLRFATGDVYPAYSSLRSDPLGTRALYESLDNIDGIAVRRNYHLLESLTFEPQTTFFYLGTAAGEFGSVPKEMIEVFDRLTQSGGRLVLTFLPVTKNHETKAKKNLSAKKKETVNNKSETKTKGNSGSARRAGKRKSSTPSRGKSGSKKIDENGVAKDSGQKNLVSVKTHWGIGMVFKDYLPVKDDKHLSIDATSNRRDLPPVISWHTNLYFDLFDDAWQTLYSYEGLPLIVERAYGKGSILVCADSYFMSNEALRSERHPQLLVWLIGGNSTIIFDEAHFGIHKQPSVAQLIRRYRFHWVFATLVVLALLFVWKSAAYFVPPSADDGLNGADVVSEKDYTQGLIALLRRNITDNQILQVCAKEWEQTFKKSKRTRAIALERIRGLAGTGSTGPKMSKDPVKEFRKISKLISEEKGYE
ncbi:MAG: DUF4350 domain-containing protein [Desulfobacterales bacterium]